MATLEEITDRIRQAAALDGEASGLDGSIKLDLRGEGFVHVAGATVSNADLPADLTVTVSRQDLEAMGRRELDPVRAMMTGRMKLSDMGLAMKMQPLIRRLLAKAG